MVPPAAVDPIQARKVADVVVSNIDALVARIEERIMTEIPFYAEGGAGSREEFQPRLRLNVEAALHVLLGGLTGAAYDPSPALETGRLRARQNAPLAELLTGYRIGFVEVCSEVLEAAQKLPDLAPELLVQLSLSVFEIHNRDADAVTHGYREEARLLLVQDERQRAALLDVLLSDTTDLATTMDVARALRLPLHGHFVLVVARSELGRDPMPRASSALAALGVTSLWRIRYDDAIGILDIGMPSRTEPVIELLARHATGPVGVSPVFTSLRRVRWAFDLAEAVLRRLGTGPAVEQFEDTPLSMLVAGGPDAARDTARDVLGGLLTLAPENRDVLLVTLQTWLDAGGSADQTGELLHCHPNTIRKRLLRIEQCTGRNLREPGGVAEVVAAVQAWLHLRS